MGGETVVEKLCVYIIILSVVKSIYRNIGRGDLHATLSPVARYQL